MEFLLLICNDPSGEEYTPRTTSSKSGPTR